MSGPSAGMAPPGAVALNINPSDDESSDDASIPTAVLVPGQAAPSGAGSNAGPAAGTPTGTAINHNPHASGHSDDDSGQDTDTGDQTASAAAPAATAAAASAVSAPPASKLTKRLSSKGSRSSRSSNGRPSTPAKAAAAPPKSRRMVHLQTVVLDTYEYHGMNDLALFLVFASLTSLVLFFHWPSSTAIFKNSVQSSFAQYGNPDWQQQTLAGQNSMFDGLEYITGFLEFSINRTTDQGFGTYVRDGSNATAPPVKAAAPIIRIGEYAEIKYARLLVSLDGNCNKGLGHLECYRDPGQDLDYLSTGRSMLERSYGWSKINSMDFRQSTHSGTPWLSYTLIAPTINNQTISPALALERLFNVTSQTTLDAGDRIDVNPDIKPYLSRFAYSITLDLLAVNVLGSSAKPDMAVFSMQMQRSDVPNREPDRAFWQITTTVPARLAFYGTGKTDTIRAVMEALTVVAVCIVTYSQVWQLRVAGWQHKSLKPYWMQFWNVLEAISTCCLFVWIAYYVALVIALKTLRKNWNIDAWDEGMSSQEQLNEMEEFANWYSGWLYGAILVNAIVVLRLVRYMRIHAGLKAFYQVFIIAAREFADFAVFLMYILLLLGLSIFAFFQLSGGNWQFLRFSDGISVMTRLTFGFLDYVEFQQYALGLGTAVAAVSFLFWVAVLLLIVYTQNIILAIVAEAYERAKAEIGSARVSFIVLVFQRLLFALVFLWYYVKLLWRAAMQCSLQLHEEELYKSFVDKKSGAWRGVALRRCAAWALCRTHSVKSLANLYQDYASLKLKTRTPWPKADDVLRSHLQSLPGAQSAAPTASKDPSQVDEQAKAALPELGEVIGYVDEEQLKALFYTALGMRREGRVRPSPFPHITDDTINQLVAGIMKVYGSDEEDADESSGAALATTTASGNSSDDGSAGSPTAGSRVPATSSKDLATGIHKTTRQGLFFTSGARRHAANHINTRKDLREAHRVHEQAARTNKEQADLMRSLKRQLAAQQTAADLQAQLLSDTNAKVAALTDALGHMVSCANSGNGSSSGLLLQSAATGASPFAAGALNASGSSLMSPGGAALMGGALAGAAGAAGAAGTRSMSVMGMMGSRRRGWGSIGGHAAQQTAAPATASGPHPAGAAGATPDAADLAAKLGEQQAMLERIVGMLQQQPPVAVQQQQQQQQQQAVQQQSASLAPVLTRVPSQYPDVPHIA